MAKAELELRPKLVQRLRLAPQIRQTLGLLPLSNIELASLIRKELEANPLLEEREETPKVEKVAPSREEEKGATSDWVEYLEDYDRGVYPTQERREPFPIEKVVAQKPTLSEHLLRQLRLSTSDRMALKIGEQIIGNLDRNGYLKVPLAEIAKAFKVREKEVAEALSLIQTFDPVGVGARDVKECLLIQIRHRKLKKPLVFKIIKEYLEDLGERRYEKIAKSLGVKIKEVQEAADFISTLEPKPGRSFGEESAQAVTPDIILTRVGREYVIALNNEGLPQLQISPLYKKMLAKGRRIKKEEREYIRNRLNAAIGLIKAIEQRERTIYKITERIVKLERDFLEKGIDYLKPLTLKRVAQDVGMHESTVSRATSNKYIQTPQGVFELKHFFTSGFGPSVEGGWTSSRSIKEAIKDQIGSEDSKKPLSDQKIANILTANLGINIARRTVAKYREEMRILPSHQRRRY